MKKKIKQTAVEWLKAELESYGSPSQLDIKWDVFDQLINQALAMEKEQIIEANSDGQYLNCISLTKRMCLDNAEQYYNETYGK